MGAIACDVAIIGGGMAALCAALSAREAGASVVLLEAAPPVLRGGNTRHSRNFRVMHPAPTPLSPGCYDAESFWSDLDQAAAGQSDPALARVLIGESAKLPHWLGGHGVRFETVASGALPYSRKTVFLLGGGKAAVNALYARAAQCGVDIRYNSEVNELHIIDGRAGPDLTVQGAGLPLSVRAGAVVVACGGFQANRDWLRQGWGVTAEHFHIRGTPHAQGRILRSLLDQGVMPVGDMAAAHLVAVDGRAPAVDGGIVTRIHGIPEGLVVDARGLRHHDEAADLASTRYARWGQRVARYPGQIAWLILDQAGRERVNPSLYAPIEAPTVMSLARALEILPAALLATVQEFNAAIGPAGSTQGLVPPKTRKAHPLLIPPFAAWPIRPGITFTGYGLKVDPTARVVLGSGASVPNLMAAGMIMAPNLLGSGYIAGAAIAIGAVFGRIAGAEAARHVLGL